MKGRDLGKKNSQMIMPYTGMDRLKTLKSIYHGISLIEVINFLRVSWTVI